jgi:hypothetical protein
MANCRRMYASNAMHLISYAWLHYEKNKTRETQQPRGLAAKMSRFAEVKSVKTRNPS